MAYTNLLAGKMPPVTVMSDPDTRATYESAALARHEALFREFGLEIPLPDDHAHPSWRALALALAGRHVPAFMGKPGRPATVADEAIKLFLASEYFARRDGIKTRAADRKTAEYFGMPHKTVIDRLKEIRRQVEYKPSGPLMQLFDRIDAEMGREALVAALAEALTDDAAFAAYISNERRKLAGDPY
jgi:hypothetical protein